MALALGLGLVRLTRNDIWFDEAASLLFAKQRGLDFFRVIMREDTHGPVYYGLLKLWILLFGESVWAVRLPSVLCGAGAVLVVAHLGARLWDRTVGLLAALLVAASPFHIFYSQEVRFYSLIGFLASLHVLCLLHLVTVPPSDSAGSKTNPRWPWWGFVATGAASVLTFYLSGLLLVAEALCILRLWNRIPRRRVLGAFVALAAICSAWLPALVWQVRHTQGSIRWIPHRTTWHFLSHAALTFTAGKGSTWFEDVMTAAIVLAAGIALARAIRSKNKGQLLLACWFAIPLLALLAISVRQPILLPRYLFMLLPAFFLLAAAAVWHPPVARLRWPLIAAVVTALVMADARYFTRFKFTERWTDAANYVRSEAAVSDVLLALPANDTATLAYYFPNLKGLRGANSPREIDRFLVRNHRLWVFTFREQDRIKPGQITQDALLLDSRDFGSLNVSSFLLRR